MIPWTPKTGPRVKKKIILDLFASPPTLPRVSMVSVTRDLIRQCTSILSQSKASFYSAHLNNIYLQDGRVSIASLQPVVHGQTCLPDVLRNYDITIRLW